MSYIRQPQLFTYDEFHAGHDDNTRLVLVLDALPDEPLLSWLREQRRGRRDDYPQEVLWRCVMAKAVYQIHTYAGLIRELLRNGSLRRLVGIGSFGRVPKAHHFSRLLKRLCSAEGLEQFQAMFEGLVAKLGAGLPQMGKHLAIDATSVHAYSNEGRRKKSDPDAAWSARPKRQRRGPEGGRVEQYTDFWFGYLVHLVVDCGTELPVQFEVTAANVNETTRFVGQLEGLKASQPELSARVETVVADAGYDSASNCQYVLERGALPVIKLRRRLKGDELCQAATCMCNESGTLICDSGHKMTYWGRDGDWLKWRCPVACGAAERCTAFGRCSSSEYGAVVKVKVWEDPRRFPGLARESAKWKRLYRKRTAAERLNSRLKDLLGLDELTVRGIGKVRVHVGVALVVLLAGAHAMVAAGKLEQARAVVRLAA